MPTSKPVSLLAGRALGAAAGTCLTLAAVCVSGSPTKAQTVLPGITVTTPSPVQHPRRPAAPPAQTAQPAAPQPDDLSGTPLQISPDEGFAATTVLSPDELARQPASTLGDALANKPGIAGTGFA